MKEQRIFILVKTLVIVVLFFSTGILFAQGGPGPPGGGVEPDCWPPPCIPIDGGIGFLVAAGVALGIKKTVDMKKKKKDEV